jgi:phosphate transport system permease protein
MSAPLGILVGIYLSEYRRQKFADFLQIIMDLLASTPSIVVGLFAYTFIVVPTKGFSALAGAGALSFIMIPVISRTSEAILKLNSKEIREAALALGLTRWRMIFFVLVRGSWSAILTGVLLAIARCAGETAPLIFTAFNNQYLSFNLREPISSLPVQIYTYAVSPFKELQARAWTGALVLLVSVFFTNLFIRLLMTPTNEKRR